MRSEPRSRQVYYFSEQGLDTFVGFKELLVLNEVESEQEVDQIMTEVEVRYGD